MEIKIIEKGVLSSDKIHTLKGKLYIPSGEIKGYFQVVHGMTEHIGRYDEFLKEIASNGYLAFAFDNLGHGYTAKDTNDLGFIAKKGGYKLLSQDVAVFYNAVREEYGDLSGARWNQWGAYLSAVFLHGVYDSCAMIGTALATLEQQAHDLQRAYAAEFKVGKKTNVLLYICRRIQLSRISWV